MLARRWTYLLILCGALLSSFPAGPKLFAQSRKAEQLRPGRLLVANRDLRDPNFAESVILIIDHSEDGAFGLIINRPTRINVAEGLPQLRGADGYHGPAYLGGPVSRNAVMALLRDKDEPHPPKHVFGDVYLISRKAEVEAALSAGAGSDDLRLYVGYSGWGAGQLENEVKRGDWYIFDPSEKVVFDPEPDTVWSRLIAQTELLTAHLLLPAHPPK
jgi:putative transcriptional regulator